MNEEHPSNSKTQHWAFFQHSQCEYFPCHQTADPQHFNCLFCYCPLYALGENCGGDFTYTARGVKDCQCCLIPHQPDSIEIIIEKFPLIAEIAKRR